MTVHTIAPRANRALPYPGGVRDWIGSVLDPARYVGRAPEQVLEFIESEIDPLLERHRSLVGQVGDVRV